MSQRACGRTPRLTEPRQARGNARVPTVNLDPTARIATGSTSRTAPSKGGTTDQPHDSTRPGHDPWTSATSTAVVIGRPGSSDCAPAIGIGAPLSSNRNVQMALALAS